MADRGDPELSWQTVVAAITVVGLLAVAQWTIFQNQFSNSEKAATADRVQIAELKADLDKYLTIREHSEYREGIVAQLGELRKRNDVIEAALAAVAGKLAREPVESGTFQAVSKATDDRVSLIQSQITDINRQIAAALIIIDNNASIRRAQPALPP